ncbi:MAG TPA: RloB family protein [Bryobacteraceae bacterium]|nr:RloB family protein [Bryobacteraceae bacterium]
MCEGQVTEPEYFRDIRQTERGLIELEIVPAGKPKSVVERAAQMKKESERQASRHRDENLLYDHVWCVFDIDEHPLVAEAKQQARDNSIELAVSNPCFELWFLLHFQDQGAHIERDKVQSLCRRHMPGYKKSPPCDTLRPYQGEAINRATQLEKRQASRRNEGGNPSTGVHRLIQQIQAACRA